MSRMRSGSCFAEVLFWPQFFSLRVESDTRVCMMNFTDWSGIFLSISTSPFEFARLLTLQNTEKQHVQTWCTDSCYILSCLLISGQTVSLKEQKVQGF